MPVFPSYRQFGGTHPETAALANLLAAAGTLSPQTGEPFSEAMLLGIGGGLGCGYILRPSPEGDAVGISLGFHNRWNRPVSFIVNLCERLGIPITLHETGGQKTAATALESALRSGAPVMAWVDQASLPYQFLATEAQGSRAHVVVVCGWEAQRGLVMVDDLGSQPFPVPLEQVLAARAAVPAQKHRLLRVEAAPVENLERAVRIGITDCVLQMAGKSRRFSLPALKHWARQLTDTGDKKGWQWVFRDRRGLYGALRSLFEAVVLAGSDGAALRNLYADFLREAEALAGDGRLADAAVLYEDLARGWAGVADAALPEYVPEFKQTRELLFERYDALKGGDLERVRAAGARLAGLQSGLDEAFPLDGRATLSLLKDLQDQLLAVYRGEYEALVLLRSIVV